MLHPLDVVTRLRVSGIFSVEGVDESEYNNITVDLPDSIYANIRHFERAIQSNSFYIQPQASTTVHEMQLNNIITSIYLQHLAASMKGKGSEIDLIAKSVSTFLLPFFSSFAPVQLEFDSISQVFQQQEVKYDDKLRPDIIMNARQ